MRLPTSSSGNAGANVLDGKAGADTLRGAAGNDTYVVDTLADVLIENAGEGTDTVQSSVTLTLAANVENLTLTGAAAINGTGNAAANTLTGNAAANVLDGAAGNDSLRGGCRQRHLHRRRDSRRRRRERQRGDGHGQCVGVVHARPATSRT